MCALEFPALEAEVWQRFRGEGLVVLGLSGSGLGGETPALVEGFRDQTGVTFPLLVDDMTFNTYANPDGSISPYPLDVVVDRFGTIRYLRHQFDADAMVATIEQLLAE